MVVVLDEGVEVIVSGHHGVRAQDVVRVRDEPGQSCGGVGVDLLRGEGGGGGRRGGEGEDARSY